jgi:hypothetical protein
MVILWLLRPFLPHLPLPNFPSATCFVGQFVHKMSPIKLAFLSFIVYRSNHIPIQIRRGCEFNYVVMMSILSLLMLSNLWVTLCRKMIVRFKKKVLRIMWSFTVKCENGELSRRYSISSAAQITNYIVELFLRNLTDTKTQSESGKLISRFRHSIASRVETFIR